MKPTDKKPEEKKPVEGPKKPEANIKLNKPPATDNKKKKDGCCWFIIFIYDYIYI